jgi:hypothetical protein
MQEASMSKFSLYIEKLKKSDLPRGKYAIFGSGPIGVRGIRDTNDLDVITYDEVFDEYEGREEWKPREFKVNERYVKIIENEGIELYKDWGPGEWDIHRLISGAEVFDGLPFVKLEEVIKWKKLSRREKDLKDLQLIEDYLQEHS